MQIKRWLPIIGIFILIYLLYQYDFTEWLNVIDDIPIALVLLILGCSLPIIVISNIEWQYLLKKHHITVSFLYSMKNIFIGYFYGFITPGGIGGYSRAYYLKDGANESLEKCIFNIGILNTIDIISLIFLSIIGAFIFSSVYPSLFIILICFCIIWVVFLGAIIHKKTWIWLVQFMVRITFLKRYQQWISNSIENLQQNLPSTNHIVITFILSVIGWIIRFSLFYWVITLFSIPVPYIHVIFIISIANIIAMVPISIYGIGTRESVLITLFALYNVSEDLIFGVSLFWYVSVWVIPSVIGGIVSVQESNK